MTAPIDEEPRTLLRRSCTMRAAMGDKQATHGPADLAGLRVLRGDER